MQQIGALVPLAHNARNEVLRSDKKKKGRGLLPGLVSFQFPAALYSSHWARVSQQQQKLRSP